MRGKLILILGLMAVFLSVTAENCVLQTKQLEVPVRDAEDVTFTTRGSAEHSGSTVVDFGPSLLNLESDSDFQVLLSAVVEAAEWRVKENRGDPDLVISGSMTVTRVNPTPTSILALARSEAGTPLLNYTSVPLASVLGDFRVAPLEDAGVSLLNEAFQEYFNARNAELQGQNVPLPDMQFRFDWSGTASSSSQNPTVDFDWQAKVKFTLTGLVEVEVPELF